MRRREFIGQAICFGTVFNIPAMDAAATTEIYGKEQMRLGDYEVSLVQRCGDSVKTLVRRRVYSSKYIAAEKFDVENVCCLFPEQDFPKGGGSVRFAVRPCNAFGRHGKPIYSDWT